MKRFAVVMGASGEIGEAIALQLAADGWSLYLHWNSTPVNRLAENLSEKFPGQEFIAVQADFTRSDGAERLAAQVYDAACIVVASGHALQKMLIDTEDAEMDALWNVHVKNPISAIRRISRYFHRHPATYVVFISSIWGETGAALETVYSSVKGAQLAFVKAYAKEMAASGTRVNAISPGFIQTKMNGNFTAEELAVIEEEIPLGLGAPRHVADAVDFLVNGKADYMTGQVLRINGGWHM
ncbi:3-oxoacyl-[acyl-carrier-protein] reductase FabG [Planococcus massiliensis]|uniref:3-oxoacyl-[acyl-carrier-protein] reductase FabG n=1 Tax=Planococcus massiliensis TaxID=1499687 RepID=A0A098EL30_9BACL|nr:SDR family oxidoreductase [Planococcus massiliensis]MCJ1907271.1 SDR family oxidoreductase [Planococcus ruber]CEG22505.1 3-oxoacyl-[acyl-carrier-protein] reductase FabG [Planococcus massiliensis]